MGGQLKRTLAATVALLATLTFPGSSATVTSFFPPAGPVTLSPATGTASTVFSLRPPAFASCSGNSQDGYRWQTYLASAAVDTSNLTFTYGPNPVLGNFVSPAFDSFSNAIVNAFPSYRPVGLISSIPTMTFAPMLGLATPPGNGAYRLGLACTQGGQIEAGRYWETTITISGVSANGFSYVVGSVPAPPTLNAVSAADGALIVEFTHAPSVPATTSYTVTATPTGAGSPVVLTLPAPATSPFAITGLFNNADYAVTMTASNAVGTSAASNTRIGRPSPPIPPPQLSVEISAPASASAQPFAVTGSFVGVVSAATPLVRQLTNGTGSVTVSPVSGFGVDDITCTDPDYAGQASTGAIDFVAAPGDAVTCTVTVSGRGSNLPAAAASSAPGFFTGPAGLSVATPPFPCGPSTVFSGTETTSITTDYGLGTESYTYSIAIPAGANPSWTTGSLPTTAVPAVGIAPFELQRTLEGAVVNGTFTPAGDGELSCVDFTGDDTTGQSLFGFDGGADTRGWFRDVTVPMEYDMTITPAIGLPVRHTGSARLRYRAFEFDNDTWRFGDPPPFDPGFHPVGTESYLEILTTAMTETITGGPLGVGGRVVAAEVLPGQPVASEQASPTTPMSISVTSPSGGVVTMSFVPGSSVRGSTGVFSVAGETVKITAPGGDTANPLQIRMRVDASRVAGTTQLQVTRNGVFVPLCAPAPTLPCVVETSTLPDGDREWVIDTISASEWAVVDVIAGPHAVSAADLVGWWTGQDTLGALAGPALTGAVSYSDAVVGRGITFDGLGVVSAGSLAAVSDAVTVEMWVKPADTGFTGRTQALITRWDFPSTDDSARTFALLLDPFSNLVWMTDETTTRRPVELRAAAPQLADGGFHHVAAVWDRSQIRLYVDGNLAASTASQGGTLNPAPSTELRLGSQMGVGDPFHFAGTVDEPTIYDRALSAAEITAIHSAGSNGKTSP